MVLIPCPVSFPVLALYDYIVWCWICVYCLSNSGKWGSPLWSLLCLHNCLVHGKYLLASMHWKFAWTHVVLHGKEWPNCFFSALRLGSNHLYYSTTNKTQKEKIKNSHSWITSPRSEVVKKLEEIYAGYYCTTYQWNSIFSWNTKSVITLNISFRFIFCSFLSIHFISNKDTDLELCKILFNFKI